MNTTEMKVLNQEKGENWVSYHADCVDVAHGLPDNSVHYSIYSPPFESLYTYSNSERDLGNSKTSDEFWQHYRYLIREAFRVMMPGRLVSIHCMNLPTSKQFHGYIGLRDFRGEIIRSFQAEGFIFASEVCIWKDPLVAMQRTKALGLLHKQICKDSAMCRQGIPDYLVTMRKPGENPEPVARKNGFDNFVGEDGPQGGVTNDPRTNKFSHVTWQKYASPVWMDINPSETLQRESAREHNDERHICPLQLQVIERGIHLWSNPNDIVWSPFSGIGSEGYVAVKAGRRFIGSELKESYWRQGVFNLKSAEGVRQSELLPLGAA